MAHVGAPPDWLWEAGALAGLAAYNALGVTAGYESHAMEPAHIEAYRKIRGDGALTMRIAATMDAADLAFDPTKVPDEASLLARLDLAKSWEEKRDPLFRFNGITLSRGGPCWPGYLRQNAPYPGPDGTLTSGKTFMPHEVEMLVVRYCLDHDLRFNMVLGGERDADEFLATMDALTKDIDAAQLDWVVQHVLMLTGDHCRRIAELGLAVTTSPGFVWGKGALYHVAASGSARRRSPISCPPASSSTSAPASPSAPTGARTIPSSSMQFAETQEFCNEGTCTHRHHHRITREESLKACTVNAARAMQWSDIGALAPGFHADMIVVDRDPSTCPVEDLADTKVLATFSRRRGGA